MSTDNTYGRSDSTTPLGGTSQTGTAAGRSAEYGDGLTGDSTDATQNATYGEQRRDYGADKAAWGDNTDGAGNDRTDAVTTDETGKLISADKVQGTAVYDADGDRLGTIDSIMINKVSGKVAYAVMSFGGFLGIGERYHPLPWHVLTYDEEKGGYNVAHSANDLRGAPNYSRDEVSSFDYGSRGREINDYYGVDTGRAAGLGAGGAALASDSRGAIGLDEGDGVGATVGQGSSGMASTNMGANRNL